MDVLRPPLIHLNGICYRKNPKTLISFKTDDDDDMAGEFCNYSTNSCQEEPCDAGFNLEETAQGFKLSIHVAAAYFKFLIGARGQMKKRLEMETRTQIRIPRQGNEGDVHVLGAERRGVVSAGTRILLIVDGAKKKLPFTHFVSFPLNARDMQDRFAEFKSDVLRDCDDDRGIDFSIFQHPAKIHLTIGTLVLMDEDEVNEAREAMRWCCEEIVSPLLKGEGLRVDIRGLEYMNDDPSEVDVLYAEIHSFDGSDKLQVICDRIVDHFCGKNLMTHQYDRVKIHATIMNTLFRRDNSGTDAPSLRGDERIAVRKDRESFDAQKLLKLFAEQDFGEHTISEIHLSTRYSTASDGYYLPAAKFKL